MVRARQRDIAQAAGVSEATVSRVLNDHPGVSEATRQSVLIALDVLGFERPTYLRRKSAGLVGLILPELTNPIFPAFAQLIETALARRGYTPILCTQIAGGIHEDDYVQSLLDHGVAGIINISGLHADSDAKPDRYFRLRELGMPLVLVNGSVDKLDVPTVVNDDVAAVELAVTHLAELGHERIGLAAGPDRFVPVIRKVWGFRGAMARHTSSAGPRSTRSSSTSCSRSTAALLLRRGCSTAGPRPSRPLPTSWRWAPCGRSARVGCGCPKTSRWSGMTTRRSSRSPTRR